MFDIGIIGGMGPAATAELFKRVVLYTLADKDQEHIKMCILNDSLIPDRTEYIINNGESPLFEILKNIRTEFDQCIDKIINGDISAKEFGGDLNYFGKGEMVTEFENACFDDSFKINTIFKDIVETEFGYHIIKKTDDKIKPLNDVKNSIISEIYSEDFLKLEENTLKNHKIKYHSFITNFEY